MLYKSDYLSISQQYKSVKSGVVTDTASNYRLDIGSSSHKALLLLFRLCSDFKNGN